jgi:Carbohydrate esterase, sialic acid-specific acetylesterase/Secretion system C-terminal sorting domain
MGIYAQPTLEITKFPKNNQLIPRNPATNIGTYSIEGSTLRASNITLLLVRVSKGDVLERNYSVNVPTNVEKFTFNIPIQIKAELKNYHIELSGLRNNQEIVLAKADNVVAGDVFIVNGQSNCIGRAETVDLNPFMRSYSDQFGWSDIDYTSPSKWAPRMARRIIEKEQIPVAVFCEAVGGVRQTWFMRQAVNPYTEGNYGIIYNRLKKAEVEKNVRALLWWQGESDGWETTLDSFKIQFKTLYNQWKEDYNTPVFYFQIRFKACTHIKPDIFEAQRQLATEIPNIEILSSNPALSHDGCHFMYLNGYDAIGEQAYNLLAAKLYNRSTVNTRPPNIVEAFFSATNEITIKMRNITGNLRTIGTPWADFKLEGCSAKITGGFVADYRIKLNFTGDTTGLTGVSYICHIDSFTQNWIVNPIGVGILLFNNVPVNKRQLTEVATVSNNTEGVQFSIYPTIVDEFINIRFISPNKKNKRLTIVNAIGQIVFEKNIENDTDETHIPIANLPKGLYFIGLDMGNQGFSRSSDVHKFIHL